MVFILENEVTQREELLPRFDALINLIDKDEDHSELRDRISSDLEGGEFRGIRDAALRLTDDGFNKFETTIRDRFNELNGQSDTPDKQAYIDALLAAYKTTVAAHTIASLTELRDIFEKEDIVKKAEEYLFEIPWEKPGMVPNPIHYINYYVYITSNNEPETWVHYNVYLKREGKTEEDGYLPEAGETQVEEEPEAQEEPEEPAFDPETVAIGEQITYDQAVEAGLVTPDPDPSSTTDSPEIKDPDEWKWVAPKRGVVETVEQPAVAATAVAATAAATTTQQPAETTTTTTDPGTEATTETTYERVATPISVADTEALLKKPALSGALILNAGKNMIEYAHRGAARALDTFGSVADVEKWKKSLDDTAIERILETGEGFLEEFMHIMSGGAMWAAIGLGIRFLLKNGLGGIFDLFTGKDSKEGAPIFNNPLELFTKHYKMEKSQSESLLGVHIHSLARYAAALKTSTTASLEGQINADDYAVLENVRQTNSQTLNTIIADLSGDDKKQKSDEDLVDYTDEFYASTEGLTLASIIQSDSSAPISWTTA